MADLLTRGVYKYNFGLGIRNEIKFIFPSKFGCGDIIDPVVLVVNSRSTLTVAVPNAAP